MIKEKGPLYDFRKMHFDIFSLIIWRKKNIQKKLMILNIYNNEFEEHTGEIVTGYHTKHAMTGKLNNSMENMQ